MRNEMKRFAGYLAGVVNPENVRSSDEVAKAEWKIVVVVDGMFKFGQAPKRAYHFRTTRSYR